MSRIDVAVICYNYGRFLRQCVDSVLAQSHKDLRVLVMDDASTDATPEVCAELAARDPRVAIHRHPVNLGHIQTYNEAI
jgi:glycosyltransferase involved in cell wall biosynthesis